MSVRGWFAVISTPVHNKNRRDNSAATGKGDQQRDDEHVHPPSLQVSR
jgi:hypothetical protein